MWSHTASVSTLPSHTAQSQHGHPISHTQLYHVIASQTNTQFLFMQIHSYHTDISGHTPSRPIWTDAYVTHSDISTQFPFHTSQACRCMLRNAVTQMWYLELHIHRRHNSWWSHVHSQGIVALLPNHTQTQAVQHVHRHIYPPHSYRHTLADHDTDTSTYSHPHRVRDMQVTHKCRSHSHIHPHTHTNARCYLVPPHTDAPITQVRHNEIMQY